MKRHKPWQTIRRVLVFVVCLLAGTTRGGASARVAEEIPAWVAPTGDRIRESCSAWLDACQASPALREKVMDLWPASDGATGPELLERVVRTAALLDADAHRLWIDCSAAGSSHRAPDHAWLFDSRLPPPLVANLRLYFARWLTHEAFYDEAIVYLSGLSADDVVDPATLFFYRAAVCHRLLLKEQGLEAVGQLLAARGQCPARYVAVAELMRNELDSLQDDSLDHIARRMEDVERRLDKGQARGPVQEIERGIVESLDRMIEQLEGQRQESGGTGSGGIQSSGPAPDSELLSGKGAGQVESKPIGDKSGWGDLPDRERQQALQGIAREFPSHYRDIIEQYFRQLADGPSAAP